MSKEAMKLALEALKQIDEAMPFPVAKLAQAALREALAEQPAQPEPVACQYAQDVAMPEYRCIGRCQYNTSPPAQRTWSGLTDEDYRELHLEMGPTYFYQDYGHAIEAKLKEKNT